MSNDEKIKTVTRRLFFTEVRISSLFSGISDDEQIYKGFFTNEPGTEVQLKLVQRNSGWFRGYSPPHFLMIGIPNIDTLCLPTKCPEVGCISYRQARGKFPANNSCMEDVSFYLSEQNQIFTEGRKELQLDLTFDPPEGRRQFNFRGTLIE